MKATIPRVPLTANSLLRLHWMQRRKDAQDWVMNILSYAGKGIHWKNHIGKAVVKIIVYRSRLQDVDNAYASMKHVLDALIRTRWIVDDSPKYLCLFVEERIGKPHRTEIAVTYDPSEKTPSVCSQSSLDL